MQKLIWILLVALALAGCGKSPEEQLREYLVQHSDLIDPSSVQIRNLKASGDNSQFCGQINSKNTLGGYVGWTPFYASAVKSSSGDINFYFEAHRNPIGVGGDYWGFVSNAQKFCGTKS